MWNRVASAAVKQWNKQKAEVAERRAQPGYTSTAAKASAAQPAAPDPNRWQQHIANREFHGRRFK